jgi:hypothetical protein
LPKSVESDNLSLDKVVTRRDVSLDQLKSQEIRARVQDAQHIADRVLILASC